MESETSITLEKNDPHSTLFTILINVTEQLVMIGDLNQDLVVNILDIVQIVNIILGDIPTQYQIEAGDLNADGIINVLDIVNIVNMILDE